MFWSENFIYINPYKCCFMGVYNRFISAIELYYIFGNDLIEKFIFVDHFVKLCNSI